MIKFITILDSTGRIKLINIDQIRKMSASMKIENGEDYIQDEDFTDIETTNGVIHKAKINFGYVLQTFEKKSINLIALSDLLKDDEEEFYTITHPQHENVEFVWRGGYQISIEQDGHSVGGINVLERNRDAVEQAIFEYIEENPNRF